MRFLATLVMAVGLVACEARSPAADSSAAAPVDTAAPVVVNATADSVRRADSVRVADSVAHRPAAPGGTKAAPTTTVRTPPRTRSDSLKLNPNIGRDSVIRRPRPFPNVDTTKRP